jgi:membrane associated rhomboid family serine protease
MLIPYSTERQLQRTPWATIALIGANAAVAVLTLASPERTLLLAFSPDTFHWWQPLTAMFTHGGIEHLVGNMLILWVFGTHVEDTIGIPKFLALYFSAGCAAELLQIAGDLAMLGHLRGGLGASGCIMGPVALFATRYRHVKVNIFYWWYYRIGTWQVDAVYVAAFYVVLDVLFGSLGFFGFHDGVAHFAHLGGFGAGLGWAFGLNLPAAAATDEAREEAAAFASAGAFGAAAARLEAALQRRPNDPDLHKQAATYFGLREKTQGRAVMHWSQALRLWISRGQWDKVVEEWPKVTRQFAPQQFEAEILCEVGDALERGGQYADAAGAYEAAVRRRGNGQDAPAAALRLGELLERMGYGAEARRWYEYVMRTWPDTIKSLEAASRLRRVSG